VTPRQLLLDYAQVISIPQPADDIAGLAALAGLPTDEFTRRYWAHRRGYDRGGSAAAYWGEVLGVAPTADRLRRLVEHDTRSWLHLDPAVLAVLDGFHRAGIAVSLLSNLPRELAAAVAGLPAFARFRTLLFSSELGLVKPDSRIFTAAAARLDAEPGEVVFVDDRPANVRAASTVGMLAVTYTGTADGLARLRPHLLPS
jgi:putative hydrolase of the HAD superfamily